MGRGEEEREKEGGREILRLIDSICWFNPQMPISDRQGWAMLKLNSIPISHKHGHGS